jgi:hypothetical protein
MLFVLTAFSSASLAEVNISIGISVPPVIAFSGPPEVVVLPGTYIYAAPDASVDIFFYQGYWWRPWNGHWYRSRSYHDSWEYYKNPPYELRRIPSNWRDEYKNHHWRGKEWHYSHIPQQEVQKNWRKWEEDKRWEKPEYRQTRHHEGRNFGPRDVRRDDRREDKRNDVRGNQRDDHRGSRR